MDLAAQAARGAWCAPSGEPLGPFVQIDEALVGGKGGPHDEFAFRHNRRKTNGVGRIAARVIEQLVARPPLTMRSLIDDTRR